MLFYKYLIFIFLVFALSASKAQVFEYTENTSDLNRIALGYSVPIPIDSLTPIDGFRTYNSLQLRHSQLVQSNSDISQINLGETLEGQTIYLYQIGDPDDVTSSGALEGSALINGTIHAREWQSPESTTALIEHLHNYRNDQHLTSYIVENLNVFVLPVLNIDGFMQTQRFPTQVTNSATTPRDGRMRRKNMRDADQSLSTVFNNLNGTDLNRNNPPYWATSNSSSSNSSSLVYHGSLPSSEPETQALHQAGEIADNVGGSNRLRMYIDTHSFSQIYFSHYTFNTVRNQLNDNLARIMRAANNFKYEYGPSASGAGIGSTDEYFANQYQALAYTLEIEPLRSASQYGGFGVSHDGFILPNSEVDRMREETTRASISGLYAMSEPPVLMSVKFIDSETNEVAVEAKWLVQNGSRELEVSTHSELVGERLYEVQLTFNKPMRALQDNIVTGFSSLSSEQGIDVDLLGEINEQAIQYSFVEDSGRWLVDNDFVNYKTDTYQIQLTLPSTFVLSSHSILRLEVSTTDMVGQLLDGDPATIINWQEGSWTNYENENGETQLATGGSDKSIRLIDDGSPLFDNPPVQEPPVATPDTDQASGGSPAIVPLVILLLFVSYKAKSINLMLSRLLLRSDK